LLRRSRILRSLVVAGLGVGALTVGLVAPSSAAHPNGAEPTSAARAAGIQERGAAEMGWKAPDRGSESLTPRATPRQDAVYGIDVASHQGEVDWQGWWDEGMRFAYVKATEGNYYENEYFAQQYNGSYDIGMIRGAYHFATPNDSSGAEQAQYFVENGGGWSADGRTLPGVLDIEYNPYGDTCYDMSSDELVAWIHDFVDTYKELTGRDPVIYTAYNWWVPCVGDSADFAETNPLWVAEYDVDAPTLFGGWSVYTFWQYTDSPLDQNVFNGDTSRLEALATG
jgi:GH25 family lysozyme M1 (1,4-beta-N-acetylmuramidase)